MIQMMRTLYSGMFAYVHLLSGKGSPLPDPRAYTVEDKWQGYGQRHEPSQKARSTNRAESSIHLLSKSGVSACQSCLRRSLTEESLQRTLIAGSCWTPTRWRRRACMRCRLAQNGTHACSDSLDEVGKGARIRVHHAHAEEAGPEDGEDPGDVSKREQPQQEEAEGAENRAVEARDEASFGRSLAAVGFRGCAVLSAS